MLKMTRVGEDCLHCRLSSLRSFCHQWFASLCIVFRGSNTERRPSRPGYTTVRRQPSRDTTIAWSV